MTERTRRTVLRSLAAGTGIALAGCVAGPDDGDGDEPGNGGDGTDPDDDGEGGEDTVLATDVFQLGPHSAVPRWYRDDEDAVGRVVVIDDEERFHAALGRPAVDESRRDEFETFTADLDFGRSVLLLVESVAPNGCYGEVEVTDVEVGEGRLHADARALDTSEGDVGCAQAITFPAALLRVDFESDPVTEAAVSLTDGWEESRTIEAGPDDALSPAPEDLDGHVRPDGDPEPIDSLVCEDENFERHPLGIGDEDDVSYGEATEDGSPVVALRVAETTYERGDSVRIRLVNVSDREITSGNRLKYSLQAYTEEGWQELRGSDGGTFAYTDEGVLHSPGEGFDWELELTESGLVADHGHDALEVCPDLQPGRYRFVYWGIPGPVAVEFDYEG